MEKELAMKTMRLLQLIDENGYRYQYSREAADSYKKAFEYLSADQRLMRFSADYFGTISDCLILYAVAQLGVSDRKTIQTFLRYMKGRAPDLNICDAENDSAVMNRISELKKSGFLFVHSYLYIGANGKSQMNSLYTITKEGNSIMNMKLEKRIPYNNWMQAKQLPELLGWAGCAFAAAHLSQAGNFCQYLDGVFRSKYLGTFYFPCELKFRVDAAPAYVAFLPGYLIFNSDYQTEGDYNELRALKANAIRNYVTVRSPKGPSYVVVVVQDKADLARMAETILVSGILEDCLERIYFTGEGAVSGQKESIESAFLKMVPKEGGELPFDFAAAIPDFLL